MHRRRTLVIATGAAMLALPLHGVGRHRHAMPQVALLAINIGAANTNDAFDAVRQGLRALGYVEGKNIHIDERFLVERIGLLPGAARRLAEQQVDVVVCIGGAAATEMFKASKTIPIVSIGTDQVDIGLAASISRPAGNVTDVSSMGTELIAKRFELLKQVVPKARRLAVVHSPDSDQGWGQRKNYEAAACSMHLELVTVPIRSAADIGVAIATIRQLDVQAVVVASSTTLLINSKAVLAAIDKLRLPAIYSGLRYPAEGGLFSYSANLVESSRRAASYVDKILKGAKPADLPIVQPTEFELVINSNTAKALGIAMPKSLLISATKIIE